MTHFFEIMKHKSYCDGYDGEVEDITDSYSESSLVMQALQWVEVKNWGLPHGTKHVTKTHDNSR